MMFQPEPDPECCSANAFLKSIIGIIIILIYLTLDII